MQLEQEVRKKTEKVGAGRSLRTSGLNRSPFGDDGAPLRRLAGSAPNGQAEFRTSDANLAWAEFN
jgi:hypothetical protein